MSSLPQRLSEVEKFFERLYRGVQTCKKCAKDPRTVLAFYLESSEKSFKNCLCSKHRRLYEEWFEACRLVEE